MGIEHKPLEPDHPLMLDGQMAPGSIEIMFRCMIEEMLIIGTPASRLVAMTRDPNYQGLFAARQTLGDARTDALLDQTLARVGQHHHRTLEHTGDTRPATLTIGCS